MDPSPTPSLGDSELEDSRFAHLMVSNFPPSEVESAEIQAAIDANSSAIAQIDSDIAPLAARREALARATRSLALLLSTKRSLPFEVLSEIFQKTVELTADPWVIAQICHRWREIALECPHIWAAIDIEYTATNPKLRPSGYPLEKLHTILNLSKNHPLTIRFSTARRFDQTAISSHTHRIFGALVACSARWESILLRCTAASFPLVAQVHGRLPILRSVVLDMNFDDSVLDAFQTAPRLLSLDISGGFQTMPPLLPWRQITHYNGDFGIWQDHTAVLEQLRDVEECRLTMTNWVENGNDKILNLPKLRKLYVARGDLMEFEAPLLEELVVEPLKMAPPPDVFGNLSGLIRRSHCRLTKLCLIGAIPTDSNDIALISVLELLPSLVDLCVQSRRLNETMQLDGLVAALSHTTPCLLPRLDRLSLGGYIIVDSNTLADMVEDRFHANPAVCNVLRAFTVLHTVNPRPFHADSLRRLEALRSAGLAFTMILGPRARVAMVNVPFFYAATSDGQYWAPEST